MSSNIAKLFYIEPDNKRIFGLDFMRFVAISLVMLSHGRELLIPLLGRAAIFLTLGGFLGVELFFVLSGFLIGGILIRILEKHGELNYTILIDFWKRRWFRTLPNYYLILILSTGVALLKRKYLFSKGYYYLYFIFSHNLTQRSPLKFFDESWSLAVEEWFYLTLPLVLMLTYFVINTLKIKLPTSKKTLIAILLLLGLGFIVRCFFAYYSNFPWEHIRLIVLCRLDSIIWGVLIAWLAYYKPKFLRKLNTPFIILGGVGILCCAGYFIAEINTAQGLNSIFSKTIYFTIINLTFALFLPVCSSIVTVKNNRWSKFVTVVSITSYSIYLTNITFTSTIILALRQMKVPFIKDFETSVSSAIVCFILFLTITQLVSILLYKYFEKPMTALRDKHRNKINDELKGTDAVKSIKI